MSVDGKTTRGDESPNLWASPEDQDFFKKLKEKIGVLIMGRKTYEAAGQPHGDGIKRIVMSHHGPTPVEILKNLADFPKNKFKTAYMPWKNGVLLKF